VSITRGRDGDLTWSAASTNLEHAREQLTRLEGTETTVEQTAARAAETRALARQLREDVEQRPVGFFCF
jgi:type II secretory pathway component PulM